MYAGALLLLGSCASPKKTIYFKQNTPNDSSVVYQDIIKQADGVILKDDILAINITSSTSFAFQDKDPVSIFNDGGTQYSITATSGGGGSGVSGYATKGYLVDNDGYIDFPVLGKLKVAGLTSRQIKDLMGSKLTSYVKEPVVEIRIINYKITILGEVGRPGTVIAPNQKINILDAIAAAGEIPITGRKDNILIIREIDGKREFARLDLNSENVFSNPYYYLRQNDIVYIEPNRIRRQETNEFLRFYLPTAMAVLSSAVTIFGIVKIANIK